MLEKTKLFVMVENQKVCIDDMAYTYNYRRMFDCCVLTHSVEIIILTFFPSTTNVIPSR